VLTSQGNTPITPLLNAGYNPVIVTHLSDRSAWNRQQHPDAALMEIKTVRCVRPWIQFLR
jgi:NTE family protein